MGHYFENDADLASKPQEIALEVCGHAFTFITDRGVFSKQRLDSGSRLLIETLIKQPLQGQLLDLGCGWGPIGIVLALMHPQLRVTLADINRRALQLARINIINHRLDARASVLESDGYQNINQRYEAIVTNPPIRAGKSVIYGFYQQAKEHLQAGGSLYIVIRKDQGAASTKAYLETIYRHVELLDRSRGYHVYQAHD